MNNYAKQRRSDLIRSNSELQRERERISSAKMKLSPKGIAYNALYQSSGKFRLVVRKWDRANKEKRHAYAAVQKAIRNSTLTDPKTLKCSYPNCNLPAAHYHHHRGYDDAHKLDVVPLCVIHHGLTRRKG